MELVAHEECARAEGLGDGGDGAVVILGVHLLLSLGLQGLELLRRLLHLQPATPW